MDDGPALLRSVLEFPAEDTPRLVYADWLQEQGQGERAEFIRVQCELAAMDEPTDRPGIYRVADPGRWAELRRRERELLKYAGAPTTTTTLEEHSDANGGFLVPREISHAPEVEWFGGDFLAYVALCPQFRRGFVESVTCTAHDFTRHAGAVLACQPVERVTIPDAVGGAPGGLWFVRWSLFAGLATEIMERIPLDLRRYNTEEDACDDLSRWCVAYGRKAALNALAPPKSRMKSQANPATDTNSL